MISYSGNIIEVPMTEESFGKRDGKPNPERPTKYEEGPWLYKRKNLYYLFWRGGPLPEFIGYSTGKTAQGPRKYGRNCNYVYGREIIHQSSGVIDFGENVFLYHNGALPGGSRFYKISKSGRAYLQ